MASAGGVAGISQRWHATGDTNARSGSRTACPACSIKLRSGGCTCDLCGTLRVFLEDRSRRTLAWPLAKERRQHVHSRIDTAELPATHVTRRQGRPYTLVLTKTEALFAREQEARIRDQTDLDWLAAKWNLRP
jgi:hypothetical protein